MGGGEAATVQLPGPTGAAGAETGILQESVAGKAGNSLCSPAFLGH